MTQPNDWVRREAERALELGKNIIPLFFRGATVATLPSADNIFARLSQLNALEVPHQYFKAAMEQLVSRFLTQPTLQELEVKTAEEHFEAAEEARANGNNELALREYSAAISRNPKRPDYFCNRSMSYYALERYNEALDDTNQALALDPTSQQLAKNKFYILQAMNDLQAALDWLKTWGMRVGTWEHDLPND
jgi:tetratricopeptide (TPR) repeat protein